jgi:hypothetical protein
VPSVLEKRWDDRLNAWAEYMHFAEDGSRVHISPVYNKIGRGRPGEGDGVPIYVGEALDTDALYQKLPEHLKRAVWVWYVETGTIGQKAERMSVHSDTLTDRVRAAKHRLEDLRRSRMHHKSKVPLPSPDRA